MEIEVRHVTWRTLRVLRVKQALALRQKQILHFFVEAQRFDMEKTRFFCQNLQFRHHNDQTIKHFDLFFLSA